MSEDAGDGTLLWSPGQFGETQLDRFRQQVNKKHRLQLSDYSDLFEWSVDSHEKFWEDFLSFSGLIYNGKYSEVVENKPMNEIPRWFNGIKLNYAENILERNDPEKVAIYVTSESRVTSKVTFGQLKTRVKRYATGLRNLGVKPGDCVVGFLPNSLEALEAYLATAAVGAIWSATSPDFGVSVSTLQLA